MERSLAELFPAPRVRQLSASLSSEASDESAVPSYTHWNPTIRWLMFRRLEVVRRMTLAGLSELRPGRGGAVLDFGCGVGMLVPVLAPRLETLFVCDEQLDPVRATAKCFGAENVVALEPEALADRIPDASLDVVIAADVLEHVDGLARLVDFFGRKLRPDGILIVSGPTENLAYRIGRWIAGFSGEYHVRSVFDVESEIRRGRFAMEAVRTLPVLPRLFRITRWRRAP